MTEQKAEVHQPSQDPINKPVPPLPRSNDREHENESFIHIDVEDSKTGARTHRYVTDNNQLRPRSGSIATIDSGPKRELRRDTREYRDAESRERRELRDREREVRDRDRDRDRDRYGDARGRDREREREPQSRGLDVDRRQHPELAVRSSRREQAAAEHPAPHSRSSPTRQQSSGPGPSQTSWFSMFTQQRDASQAEIMHLRRLLHEYDNRETELRTQLAAAERRLVVVTRDLEESRSFVAKEDSDAKELITSFEDINEAVDDLAYLISEHFDQHDASFPIEAARLQNIPEVLVPILKVAATNQAALEEAVGPIICCLLHHTLYCNVFLPWSPNISDVKNQACIALYNLICKREPQDRAARWRSMTYQNCDPNRDDVAFANNLTEVFFANLSSSLKQLLPDSSSFKPEALLEKFSTTVNKIVHSALRLQDKTKATYLSFDYEPFIARANTPFDRAWFDAMDKASNWPFQRHSDAMISGTLQDVVLAPTSIGLRASKGVVGTKGEITRSVKVVVRAKALVGRCTYIGKVQELQSDLPPPNLESDPRQ